MKQAYLFNSKFGKASVKAIEPYLNICTIAKFKDFRDKILIRYGNRTIVTTNANTITYNKSSAIKTAVNKKLSRELFIKNNVSTPNFITPENFKPCVIRPLSHFQGRHFTFIDNEKEFLEHYHFNNKTHYYSEFIDKTQEFRVHCAHGKVLVLSEKAPPEELVLAWNRHNSEEGFKVITWNNAESYHNLMTQALKSIEALGLDFGAVDVIIKDDVPYVLEVNTRWDMSNSNYTAKRYAMYFDWLQSDRRKEHWDFNKFNKAKSLFWKNSQLK